MKTIGVLLMGVGALMKVYLEEYIKKKAEKDVKEGMNKGITKEIQNVNQSIENNGEAITLSGLLEQKITMSVKYIMLFTLAVAAVSSYSGYQANESASNSPEHQQTTIINDNSVVYNNNQYGIQVEGDITSSEVQVNTGETNEEEQQLEMTEEMTEEIMEETVKEFSKFLTNMLNLNTIDMFLAK